MRRRRAALALAAIVLSSARPVTAGHVLFDVTDRHVLDASDADAAVAPGRTADLLLVAVLRERLASGELSLTDQVTVLPVAGDRGPHLSAQEPIEIGELLQLLLLTDSRTAAKTLAWAAGPSIGRALTRMQQISVRLGLKRTTVADDWPFAAGLATAGAAGRRGATTARELSRLALVVASDPEIRRRLSLDGVPISNGGQIVRATSPLIAIHDDVVSPAPGGSIASVRIALAERDNLTLLAVTTGPRADEELAATLQRGFSRYRRVELVREGQAVGPTVHVRGGIIPSFNAVAAEPWALTTQDSTPTSIAFRLQLPAEIDAPVEVHQPLGELVVERDGRVLAVVPLVAPQAIAPSGWLDTAHRSDDQ
jgi:D-alanyl-D-alanine carboxypeptidase (penicillin-binding protein 5/6)